MLAAPEPQPAKACAHARPRVHVPEETRGLLQTDVLREQRLWAWPPLSTSYSRRTPFPGPWHVSAGAHLQTAPPTPFASGRKWITFIPKRRSPPTKEIPAPQSNTPSRRVPEAFSALKAGQFSCPCQFTFPNQGLYLSTFLLNELLSEEQILGHALYMRPEWTPNSISQVLWHFALFDAIRRGSRNQLDVPDRPETI